MTADTITLGDVEIARVIEWSGPIRTARFIIPDSDEETWRRNRGGSSRTSGLRPMMPTAATSRPGSCAARARPFWWTPASGTTGSARRFRSSRG